PPAAAPLFCPALDGLRQLAIITFSSNDKGAAMALGLIGMKVGMTQVYDAQGKIKPVTVLEVGPCPVLQVRTPERDGYNAVQLGFRDKARRKANRAERGHVAGDFSSNRRKARA